MRNKTIFKRVLTGMLTAVMMLSGVTISSQEANAAETTGLTELQGEENGDAVKYIQMTGEDFHKYYVEQSKTAPIKEGYLFGGWYADEGDTVITADTATTVENSASAIVYAKFVPAYVLSVKAQNYLATKASENGVASEDNKTTTRVVSSVDNLKYKELGFKVTIEGKETVIKEITKVWEKLAVGTEVCGTDPIFGKASEYFFVLNVNKIPETKWGNAIYVRPYWITEDGTTVEGLSKYVYTEDGLKKYISVPINLNDVSEVAAGVLKISYDNSKMEFVECAVGKVFAEMEINPQDGMVRCVGNVDTSGATFENVKANDMYITLRFKMKEGATALMDRKVDDTTDETYKFTVKSEDFSNFAEDHVAINAWDVQY